jgi:hypothetical protein
MSVHFIEANNSESTEFGQLGISDYKMAFFHDDHGFSDNLFPLPEGMNESEIPDFVHIVINSKLYQERSACFGVRLPNEPIQPNLLIIKTIRRDSIPRAHSLADEVIQLMIDDKRPRINLTIGESLVQTSDAAVALLNGVVSPVELFDYFPMSSV